MGLFASFTYMTGLFIISLLLAFFAVKLGINLRKKKNASAVKEKDN